ncbi:hypothetical protein CYG49_02320 [Candidatus Saccharibacteria bacterium]|nr:MAG: hypothetical protein CYG49_02320 [Candidatus Saccharibacteria bacterium]
MKNLRVTAGVLLAGAALLAALSYGAYINAPETLKYVPACDICPAFGVMRSKDYTQTRLLAGGSVILLLAGTGLLFKAKRSNAKVAK